MIKDCQFSDLSFKIIRTVTYDVNLHPVAWQRLARLSGRYLCGSATSSTGGSGTFDMLVKVYNIKFKF